MTSTRSPRVLWVGDSPTVSTGFARCTREVCGVLHASGWDVHVLGLNYFADPHDYPYRIWPCRQPFDGGHDAFGVGRLPRLIDRLRPDVVVLLNDPWNISEYHKEIARYGLPAESTPPIVGCLAVDAKNQRGDQLNDLAHVVVWTRFAGEELIKGGYSGECSIIPLGVDTDLFYPRDRSESRSLVCPAGLPEDAFIVGVVGRNQTRKRLDLTISYFAEWITRYNITNAWLFLHVAPTGDRGCDIRSLVRYHGLSGRVILSDPGIERGTDNTLMPHVYSAFDVHLTTSQAEGWHLPSLEAMACGVPCIVPDFAALSEWPGDAAVKVHCSHTTPTAPLNSLMYTIGEVPDRVSTIAALHRMYVAGERREEYGRRGRELSLEARFRWSNIGASFRDVLDGVVSSDRVAAHRDEVAACA